MNPVIVTLLAAGTLFHAMLKSSIPARGAMLAQSPTQVTLVFTEGVNLAGTSATILRNDSSVVARLALKRGGNADTVRAPVTTTLAPGKYLIRWRAAAADDGHRTTGVVDFSVKGK